MKLATLLGVTLAGSLLVPTLALAAWSSDPVTVQGTTDRCPRVAVASDAAGGAIVVWQQDDAANAAVHRLLARRLLANGDLDPAWPVDGAVVSTGTLDRGQLGAVGDESGGAYVWWTEGASIYVTRLAAGGEVAAAWPVRGRAIGSLGFETNSLYTRRPDFRADGQGGLWAGWLAGTVPMTGGRLIHLGPNNTGAGGWPNAARGYAPSDPSMLGLQTIDFTYGPTADGGAWIAWGDSYLDEAGFHEGSWRLSRVTAGGGYAPGWDDVGLVQAPLHAEWMGSGPAPSPFYAADQAAIAPDGTDGAYFLRTDFNDAGYGIEMRRVLFHLAADGSPVAGWPAAGIAPNGQEWTGAGDGGPDYSVGLRFHPVLGLLAIQPQFATHGNALGVFHVGADQSRSGVASVGIDTQPGGYALSTSAAGDVFLSSFCPDGPYGPYSPNAYLRVDQTLGNGAKGPGFTEFHPEIAWHWYDGMGLAAVGNGSAIFAWSQSNQLHGVFARKLGPNGVITGAPIAAGFGAAMRLHFAPGRGVVARFGATADGRVRLVDVSGRVRATADVSGASEVTLAGTDALAPGVYFATHQRADGQGECARVVVMR